jgi:tripartite-type tricarboxylate transporter receptor subunit TctC
LIMLAAGLCAGVSPGHAQGAYPDRPIQLIVGFSAGGPADIVARLVAGKLSEVLGKQVFVENRAGASGNIATEAVARAAPDGYTLLLVAPPNAVNETLFPDFKYKFGTDLTPVAPIAETSLAIVANPALKVHSIKELIAAAKASPTPLLYATAGRGTATHLAGELFSQASGVKLQPVHYKGGGETLKDLLSGEIKVMFSSIPPVLGLLGDKKLVGLATTGAKRDPTLPNLPTVEEEGLPRFNLTLWYGLAAPTGTPAAVIQKVAQATAAALQDQKVVEALAKNGYHPMPGGTKEFAERVREEVKKWAEVIRKSDTVKQ